jgi:hypothetical protein
MKITVKQLNQSIDPLIKLGGLLTEPALKLRMARVIKQVRAEKELIDQIRQEAAVKCGAEMLGDGRVNVKGDQIKVLTEEFKKLDNEEVELRFDTFTLESLESHLNSNDLVDLEWLYGGLEESALSIVPADKEAAA